MQKKQIERPAYVIESVDNALHLLQALRDGGALRLTDAALELKVAPSTAHRLLSMLVYRGFAVQDEKRSYHPGPALGAGPAQRGWTRDFTDRCRPHLETLCARCGETTNLVIRVGTQVRFLASAESSKPVRVGNRQGQVLDAELASGGRILLAELPRTTLEQLYLLPEGAVAEGDTARRLPAGRFEKFLAELATCRRAGFALNLQQTENGVTAFGVAVHNRMGTALGAVTVAVPAARFRAHAQGPLVAQIQRTVREVEVDVADLNP